MGETCTQWFVALGGGGGGAQASTDARPAASIALCSAILASLSWWRCSSMDLASSWMREEWHIDTSDGAGADWGIGQSPSIEKMTVASIKRSIAMHTSFVTLTLPLEQPTSTPAVSREQLNEMVMVAASCGLHPTLDHGMQAAGSRGGGMTRVYSKMPWVPMIFLPPVAAQTTVCPGPTRALLPERW